MQNIGPLKFIILAFFAVLIQAGLFWSPQARANPQGNLPTDGSPIDVKNLATRYTDQLLSTELPPEITQFYDSLDEAQKEKFQLNRKTMLSGIEKSMGKIRLSLGVGSLVTEKLYFVKEKVTSVFKKKNVEIAGADVAEGETQLEFEFKKTLRDRGELVVQTILLGIDRRLWQQAPIVAKSNEFGVSAAVGIQALGGIGSKGLGGILSLGINVGYNSDKQAVVFQTYLETEKYQSTVMKAVFVAGINGKLGIVVSNQQELMETQNNKGFSFYPPMIPAYSSGSPNHFSSGFSSGLTVPPSPIGDFLTFTNSTQQNVLIRVVVSPLLKGFVRVKVLGMGAFERSIEQVREAFDFSLGARSCRKVLAF